MNIIFSRKGFDSTNGGYKSPIFPDGTLFSIPIPDKNASIYYCDLNFKYKNEPIQKILNELTGKKIKLPSKKIHDCDYSSCKFKCHLDPMVIDEPLFNGIAFGQQGASEQHLRKQNVKRGDIFFFFGWFQKVEKRDGRWRYKKEPDVHMLWAYMEVGEILALDKIDKRTVIERYPFLKKHPHIENNYKKNTIYLSSKYKIFKYKEKLILTDMDREEKVLRSKWKLPECFNHPEAFTYLKNFLPENEYVQIRSPGRGQEFVLNIEKVKSKRDRNCIMKFIMEIIE